MAGIGKYKKGVAFKLKSGNNPSFEQMGSSPANLNNFGIGPGSSPYRNENTENKDKDTENTKKTENTTKEQGGDAKTADPTWLKALKIGTTVLSGGIQGVYGGQREVPKINWGKREKEVTKPTPGEGIVSSILGEDYKLGDLAKKDAKSKYSLTKDYKKPKTKIQA